MVSKNKVIVFVKNTISGKVKTRLAKTIGKDEALRVYLRLLAITKEEVSKVRAEKEVWYAWEVSENDIWDENYFKKKVQIEGDLGEKMKDAFKKSFDSGGEKIVLIGSDCPTLTNEVLEQAFNELNTSDVVFGPSEDGGYYLIGMSSYNPEVLEGIDWSTEKVMEQTEAKAKHIGIKLTKLKYLNDIDTEQDWKEYLANVN
ncbi:MAG TPA: glycosyltransferase [Balneola sp.]|nr:glycosyltransferase [Balneola sp.]MAO77242.1 glycosyltransferase [Balneola sp.]MBF63044.1 glycosyltransferase [Balneola sp.]HAH52103.1 glycosyltransferase [Balneola sp.]HBZ39202.1 glycosyltransferase [Balneola sp.]